MMDIKQFCDKYETLGGVLSGDFHDSFGDESDESLAKRIVIKELPHPETARRLVRDCERVLQNIDQEWQVLGETANRPFDDVEDARRWLLTIYAVWETVASKRDNRRPS